MLDGLMRRLIDPPLAALARPLAARGLPADAVTCAGLGLGLASAAAIALASPAWVSLPLLLAGRACDGLDGAVARALPAAQRGPSDFGGYIDIVFDFVFYGAVPLAFAARDPAANALAAAALLFAFYANGASFLAYATLAAKRGLVTQARGDKSLYFTTGLAEGSETIAVFALMCLRPALFVPLAYGFALVCALTTVSRILLARQTFR